VTKKKDAGVQVRTRLEAALVDLALDPIPFDDPWGSQSRTATLLTRHARQPVGATEGEDLFQDLCRRRILREKPRTKTTSDVVVTSAGRAALAEYVGLHPFAAGVGVEHGPMIAKLARWCGTHFASDMGGVLSGSRFPFTKPRVKEPQRVFEGLFTKWIDSGRPQFVLGLVQECCAQTWWPGRDGERPPALLELMGLIQHLGVLVTWDGRIVPTAEAADEERMLRSMKSPGASEVTRPVPDAALPDRDNIPWDGPENDFTKEFVVPLLQALRFQAVRFVGGPTEDGKDVVCRYTSLLGKPRWVHVQVKMGLSGVAKHGDMVELKEQIDRAFDMPFPDPMSGQQVYASEVWVVVASKLTATAQRCVVSITNGRARKSNLTVLDRPELESLYDLARGGS